MMHAAEVIAGPKSAAFIVNVAQVVASKFWLTRRSAVRLVKLRALTPATIAQVSAIVFRLAILVPLACFTGIHRKKALTNSPEPTPLRARFGLVVALFMAWLISDVRRNSSQAALARYWMVRSSGSFISR